MTLKTQIETALKARGLMSFIPGGVERSASRREECILDFRAVRSVREAIAVADALKAEYDRLGG